MDNQTFTAVIGVAGVLLGSTLGGLISFLSIRSVRRMDWELTLIEKDIRSREVLYADFLTEANRQMIDSLSGNAITTSELKNLVAL